MVKRQICNLLSGGSIPPIGFLSHVAQLAEHLTVNQGVAGSIPAVGAKTESVLVVIEAVEGSPTTRSDSS